MGEMSPRCGGASTTLRDTGWPPRQARPALRTVRPARDATPRSAPCAIEAAVTSLSWIPSEAVTGTEQGGVRHGLHPLRRAAAGRRSTTSTRCATADRFRFANHPVGVDRGRGRTDRRRRLHGRRPHGGDDGGGRRPGRRPSPPCRSPTCSSQRSIEPTDASATFVQTVGGHTAVPAPRRVNRPPFVQFQAPTVWTTLSLTIHADGRSELRADRRQPVPAPLGLRRRRQARRPRPAWPTSRTGGGTRSPSTRPGATRTRPRW